MVHHVVLFNLQPHVLPIKLEEMMMNTRMQLLKIPEVRNLKCGKTIDPSNHWQFFISADFESMDKLALFHEDPIYIKFVQETLHPNTQESLHLNYEMEPGKNVKYS